MHPALPHQPAVPTHRIYRLGFVVAAALAVYAVATFHAEPRGLLNLWTWTMTALLAVAVTLLGSGGHPRLRAARDRAERRGLHLPLFAAAVGLGVITTVRYAIFLQIGGDSVGISPALWLLAIAALVASVTPMERPAIRPWLLANRAELIGVGLLVTVGALMRFWQLGALPRVINGDEGLIGMWAEDIGRASGTLTRPFAAMDGVGTLYLQVMQTVFYLIGSTPFALRLLPAVAGTLALPATYVLARHLLGRPAAVAAAALLTFSHVHLHFSRTVAVSYIYATLFVPLALYFLITGLERRSPLRLVLSVLMVGLHINTYVDGWVWLVLLFLILAAWAVVDRSIFRGNAFPLAMFAVALAVIISPMVTWALTFPADFFSRMTVDGTISSGWLAQEAAASGKPAPLIMLELLGAALGTFTHRPFTDFYGVGVPTLDAVAAALWVIGTVVALARTWDRRMVALNGWFWGGVVALGPTTVPVSTYHYRLLVVLPAAVILAALALQLVLARAQSVLAWFGGTSPADQRRMAAAALAAVLVASAASNLQTYYGTFIGACKYETTATRQAGLLGKYLHDKPASVAVFVLPSETGFRAGPYRSLDFLSRRANVVNLEEEIGSDQPPALAGPFTSGMIVVSGVDRAGELERLYDWYPDGRRTTVLDCGDETLHLFEWRLPIVISS